MQRAAFFRAGEATPAASFALHRRSKPASPIFQFHADIRKGKRCFVLTGIMADVCQEQKNCFIDRAAVDARIVIYWQFGRDGKSPYLILAIPIELSVPGSKNRSCDQMLSPRLLANGNSASFTRSKWNNPLGSITKHIVSDSVRHR
jgi:hypothetical protein